MGVGVGVCGGGGDHVYGKAVRPGLPVPTSPCRLCGRKATPKKKKKKKKRKKKKKEDETIGAREFRDSEVKILILEARNAM